MIRSSTIGAAVAAESTIGAAVAAATLGGVRVERWWRCQSATTVPDSREATVVAPALDSPLGLWRS